MKKSIYLLALPTFIACGMFWEFRKIHEIDGMQWNRNDVQTFEFNMDQSKNLDVWILIRHVYGFSLDHITVDMSMTHNGEVVYSEPVQILIKDAQGEYVGQGSVDLWDVEQRILEAYSFEQGDYVVTLQHAMPQEKLGLVMEVGLQLTQPGE